MKAREQTKVRVMQNNTKSIGFPEVNMVADASELGLDPGEWPEQLTTNLGSGRPFVVEENALPQFVRYKQEFGVLTLTVFND